MCIIWLHEHNWIEDKMLYCLWFLVYACPLFFEFVSLAQTSSLDQFTRRLRQNERQRHNWQRRREQMASPHITISLSKRTWCRQSHSIRELSLHKWNEIESLFPSSVMGIITMFDVNRTSENKRNFRSTMERKRDEIDFYFFLAVTAQCAWQYDARLVSASVCVLVCGCVTISMLCLRLKQMSQHVQASQEPKLGTK